MSDDERQRWDKKWATADHFMDVHPLLAGRADQLQGRLALDLACGPGRHALWLAERGWHVLAVDISGVALRIGRAEARRRGLAKRVLFVQADLDEWWLPAAAFDLITVFRFLDRRLFPAIRAGLRPGGLLVYATRHDGFLAVNPAATPAFLLRPRELLDYFRDWEILLWQETAVESWLIARRPQPLLRR